MAGWKEESMNNATTKQIRAAFTEWERLYRENPDKFTSEQEHRSMSAKTYGDLCTPYFLSILAKISRAKK
jgi:hypothetical protein